MGEGVGCPAALLSPTQTSNPLYACRVLYLESLKPSNSLCSLKDRLHPRGATYSYFPKGGGSIPPQPHILPSPPNTPDPPPASLALTHAHSRTHAHTTCSISCEALAGLFWLPSRLLPESVFHIPFSASMSLNRTNKGSRRKKRKKEKKNTKNADIGIALGSMHRSIAVSCSPSGGAFPSMSTSLQTSSSRYDSPAMQLRA